MNTPVQPVIQQGSFLLRPYTVTEFSKLYGVTKKTFRKWIHPFVGIIGERQGYYYSVLQVQIIIDRLGIPTEIPLDN